MKHISLAASSEMGRLSRIIYNQLLSTEIKTNCSGRRRRRKKFTVCATAESCALCLWMSIPEWTLTSQSSQTGLNYSNGHQFRAQKQEEA